MAEGGDLAPYGGPRAPGSSNSQPARYTAEIIDVSGITDRSLLQPGDARLSTYRISKPWGLSRTLWETFLICDRETNSVLEFSRSFRVICNITESIGMRTPCKAVSMIQNDKKIHNRN